MESLIRRVASRRLDQVHKPKSPQEIVHQKRTGIDVLPIKSCTKHVVKAPKSEGVVDPKSGERRRVSLPFEWQQGEEGCSERGFL
ncbi:hypothetical protein TNCV_3770111 [Trichonephila clavipes]|nr:hypothetical protein TNCV_3770111 [Trichonephila clavipes]